jgi:glyoxylase-like metal-dependent hydrolase (beta-lactamase superfamily II)
MTQLPPAGELTPITERASLLLAPNPGPMTLDGTNTWLLREPGASAVVVIDPGPDDVEHLDRIVAAVDAQDARIIAIMLTHDHPDHIAGVRALTDRIGVRVLARRDDSLRVGRQSIGGIEIEVLSTPGHTADSVSFHVVADDAVITGDTVLGRGSTVVAYPDGNLAQYLQSLDEVRRLVDSGVTTVLPGHGPVVTDAASAVDAYIAHRHMRLDQIRAAQVAGATSVDDILDVVYADVPDAIRFAAAASVMAQLEYLEYSAKS